MACFYGYETRWIGLDRLYKLFVQSSGVAGCYVGGQLLSMHVLQEPQEFADPDLLIKYSGNDTQPAGHEMMDRRNLWIPNTEIRNISFDNSGSVWVANTPNSGSVRINFHKGRGLRFVLLGQQDRDAIKGDFSAAGYATS